MNFRDADMRERREYLRKMIQEAVELHYWLKIGKKIYAPEEARELVMKDSLPHFTHQTLVLVDPVKILEYEDKKIADMISSYNKRRAEFVRRINLYFHQKVK